MTDLYLGDHKKGEIEIVRELPVFQNEFATLYNDMVRFPDGTKGHYIRFLWNVDYGVAVIPRKHDKIMLIREFRHVRRAWGWQIVMGFGEDHITPKECAEMELYEETGCVAKSIELVGKIPGPTLIHLYEVEIGEQYEPVREGTEAISDVRYFSKEEVRELLNTGQVVEPNSYLILLNFCS
ncbi:hypothetical protein A6E01_19660 (plasmid) [Vibrio breoganii]|uniref:Nudix hydrolase domain-containing protein n=1 Tax=Vibrio breoganii TaxID=553239 RepID=A0AAN0XZM3_9VIBR|nr:NUDIX hydrolase [Vibrio breoganii]ANO35432.1 hypothetical protein A6E01_19660 [Vibrio breoganii]PML13965.1 hypothetical protein BCT84_12455 [Vibrio breoganii]